MRTTARSLQETTRARTGESDGQLTSNLDPNHSLFTSRGFFVHPWILWEIPIRRYIHEKQTNTFELFLHKIASLSGDFWHSRGHHVAARSDSIEILSFEVGFLNP